MGNAVSLEVADLYDSISIRWNSFVVVVAIDSDVGMRVMLALVGAYATCSLLSALIAENKATLSLFRV